MTEGEEWRRFILAILIGYTVGNALTIVIFETCVDGFGNWHLPGWRGRMEPYEIVFQSHRHPIYTVQGVPEDTSGIEAGARP